MSVTHDLSALSEVVAIGVGEMLGVVGTGIICGVSKSNQVEGNLLRLRKTSPLSCTVLPALEVARIKALVPLAFLDMTRNSTTSGKAKTVAARDWEMERSQRAYREL